MLLQRLPVNTQSKHIGIIQNQKRSMGGDWVCGKCQLGNFHWRTQCRRCNEPFASLSRVHAFAPVPRVRNFRPGDWFCDAGLCRAHNYANRHSCFKCGTIKSIPFFSGIVGYYNLVFPPVNFAILGQTVAQISPRGWKTGDWFCLCLGCNAHNYATRVQCYRCKTPKGFVTTNFVASGLQYL